MEFAVSDVPRAELQRLNKRMDDLQSQVELNTREVADVRRSAEATGKSMEAIAKSLETMASRLGVIEGYVETIVNIRQFTVWLWPVVVAVLIIFGSRAF